MHTQDEDKLLIILPKNVRTFWATGLQLYRSNSTIAEGSSFCIGKPVMMIYDHRDQLVVPILAEGFEGNFIIVSEIGNLNSVPS